MLSCDNLVMQQNSSLITRVQHYLDAVLGIPNSAYGEWSGQDQLPYHLRDTFDFRQMELLGDRVVLALDRRSGESSPDEVRAWLNKVRSIAQHPTAYVTDTLPSYRRKRLIEQKVPFIVPGNQLYLPDLGVDLREYFRRPSAPRTLLSPAAQAMLITALLREQWRSEWDPGAEAAALGYTAMTLSRVTRELVAAGIGQTYKAGRKQYLAISYSARETWEKASPSLRSPVQHVFPVHAPARTFKSLRLAGLSALSRHSMLAEPSLPVYAVSRTEWQALKGKVTEVPEASPGAQQFQLWTYSPALKQRSDTVDPLSLILSLRDITDERIQRALDQVKEQLPW